MGGAAQEEKLVGKGLQQGRVAGAEMKLVTEKTRKNE